MSPRNITLLLDSSGIGGIESHVATLAETLRESGRTCTILFLADHGKTPFHQQLQARGLAYQVLKRPRDLWFWLRRHRPECLHTHGYKAGVMGRLMARLCAIPVVSTFHAGERARFPVSLYQWLDEKTAGLGESIAVSRPIAARLPPSTTVLANFIRVPAFPRKHAPRNRIGFVGRLSHEKAPDRFLAIARAMVENDVEWHVFGDGPMRCDLEAGAPDSVTFHGFQTDMNAIWPHLDLLVIPSRAEGLPMAALEAIARGIPVLASNVGAMSDVIGDQQAGWIIPQGPDCAVVESAVPIIRHWLHMSANERDTLRRSTHGHAATCFGDAAALPALLAVYARACA